MSRCVPIVKKEDPNISNEHAAGKCGGIYDGSKKKKKSSDSVMDDAEQLEKFHQEYRELSEDGVTESDTEKLEKLGKE